MLFRVYSKWIDGTDKSCERDKLNLGFGHDLARELIAEAKNFAQSNTYLAERGSYIASEKVAFRSGYPREYPRWRTLSGWVIAYRPPVARLVRGFFRRAAYLGACA